MVRGTSCLNRRKVLQSLGAAGGLTALAGCVGSNGDEDLGERVPEVPIQYWSDVGGTTDEYEDHIPTLQKNWGELGIEIGPFGEAYASIVGSLAADDRERRLTFFVHGPDPARVDPNEMLRRWGIHRAGNTGVDNPSNYANCEYTDLVFQQSREGDLDARTELVHDAVEMRGEDMFAINTCKRVEMSMYNEETVELGGVGEHGASNQNEHLIRESEPIDGDEFTIALNPTSLQTQNYYTYADVPSIMVWSRIVNQPLMEYDPEYELQPVLADEVEVEDATDVYVTLRDGTFHNGDQITAEDVKFTFDLVLGNPGSYPMANDPNYDEIEVIDDETVLFTGDEPDPALQTRRFVTWGILHQDSWEEAGAMDNPGEAYPDEIIGSGSFEVTSFETDQVLALEPHEGHPLYGEEDRFTPEHSVIGSVWPEEESMVQSFMSEEVDIMTSVTASTIDRVEEQTDFGARSVTPVWTTTVMYPEMAAAPTKFPEFREALGMSIDREHLNQLIFGGLTEPAMSADLWQEGYPYLPDDDRLTYYTDDEHGDIEGARQVLEDAGWGWDSAGRLHYPEDADLDPLWEAGERPGPDNFDCMEEVDGEYLFVDPNGDPYEH